MKIRLLFVLVLSFITTVSIAAQTRTVSNSDLERFRQKRLEAERDYRENYARLGFPSPEELERQIERSRVERAALSERLRAESLERERISLERQIAESEAQARSLQYQVDNRPRYENDYFSNYAPYGFYTYQNFGYRRNRFGRGNYNTNTPRIEYRNNIPVIINRRPPQRIFAPRQTNHRGRN